MAAVAAKLIPCFLFVLCDGGGVEHTGLGAEVWIERGTGLGAEMCACYMAAAS
jgi:hypothetical protein